MLFFNYEKLYIATHGNSHLIIKHFKEKSTTGNNWIINESIIYYPPGGVSTQQLAEYLGMCALRNYADLRVYGKKHLDILRIPPWIPEEAYMTNPLMTISDIS